MYHVLHRVPLTRKRELIFAFKNSTFLSKWRTWCNSVSSGIIKGGSFNKILLCKLLATEAQSRVIRRGKWRWQSVDLELYNFSLFQSDHKDESTNVYDHVYHRENSALLGISFRKRRPVTCNFRYHTNLSGNLVFVSFEKAMNEIHELLYIIVLRK